MRIPPKLFAIFLQSALEVFAWIVVLLSSRQQVSTKMRRRSMPPQKMALQLLKVTKVPPCRSHSVPLNRNVSDQGAGPRRTSMANIASIIEQGIAGRCQHCSSAKLVPLVDKDHLLKGKILGCPLSFLNVLMMGIGFMLNVGAGEATFTIQTVVLNSVNDDYFQGTPTMGYSLSAICSATQFLGYTMGPSFVAFTGPKLGMVLGSLCICFYVGSYIRPLTVPLYMGSALFGFGLGVVWAVQGYFITVNSLPKNVLRNTGIFLALYQSSLTSASLFYFLMVRGSLSITPHTRIVVFSTLLAISVAGVLAFSLVIHSWTGKIPLAPDTSDTSKPKDEHSGCSSCSVSLSPEPAKIAATHRKPWLAFLSTVKFLWERNILILTPYFIYIGFEQSMWTTLYPTALGYTTRFGTLRESMVGLNGLFVGVGEITGGLVLGLVGTWLNAFGKDGALLGGLLVHIAALYMTFLNTPLMASLEMTEDPAYIGPSAYMALVTSFLFGFGDVIWCAQLMAYLGEVYRYEVVSVFTVYHSWSAIAAAALFGLSTVVSLPYLLLMMVVVAVIAMAGFCVVEWRAYTQQQLLLHLKKLQNEREIVSSREGN